MKRILLMSMLAVGLQVASYAAQKGDESSGSLYGVVPDYETEDANLDQRHNLRVSTEDEGESRRPKLYRSNARYFQPFNPPRHYAYVPCHGSRTENSGRDQRDRAHVARICKCCKIGCFSVVGTCLTAGSCAAGLPWIGCGLGITTVGLTYVAVKKNQ